MSNNCSIFLAEQVPLGQDADEVSKCLLDVIRPYAVRLKNFGVILNRDYQTVCALILNICITTNVKLSMLTFSCPCKHQLVFDS